MNGSGRAGPSVEEMMDYIIENEGCECADAYGGLQSFFRYMATDEQKTEILKMVGKHVEEVYIELKIEDEYESEQEKHGQVDLCVDLIESDLGSRKGFDLHELDEEIREEIKESWRKIIRTHY